MNSFMGLWRLLDRKQRRRLMFLQLVSLLMAISTVSGIAAVLPFFTVLTDPSSVNRHWLLRFCFTHLGFVDDRQFVLALGLSFCVAVIVANVINFTGSMAMYRFSFRVGESFQTALLDEYLRRGYGFHSQASGSVLASNIIHETARISGGILQNGLVLVTNLVTIALIVGSVMAVNPLVAVAAIGALGTSYSALYLFTRGRLMRNGLVESHHFAQRSKVLSESFGAIKEIIVLKAFSFFTRKYAESCRSISRSLASTIAISQCPRHVVEIAMVCGLVLGALYLSGRNGGAGHWIAQLSFIGLASYRLLPALQQAFNAMVRIRADRPAFERIGADLAAARAREAAGVSSAAGDTWQGRPKVEVRLEGASFQYAAARSNAISDITLRISAGTVVGFVGANGSGKTTLIDVLTGLLIPQSGSVLVDGISLADGNRAAWLSNIAYVPQDIFLLDCTLAENVAMGVVAAQIDAQRLRAVVKLARLEECVASLPNGYDELLGERGFRLSGGQRQRLGIARALYRGASLLILDEATSAQDVGAENEIVDMLLTLRRDRTIVMIAHRLRSLQHCDLIFEMMHGRIARSGSYRDLTCSNRTPAPVLQDRQTAR